LHDNPCMVFDFYYTLQDTKLLGAYEFLKVRSTQGKEMSIKFH